MDDESEIYDTVEALIERRRCELSVGGADAYHLSFSI